MIFETMILSLIIGKIRGGKIQNLNQLHIKAWYLFIISILIKTLSLLIISRFDNKLSSFVIDYFKYIHVFIYLLLIIGLTVNWKTLSLRMILVGTILNFLPILFNKGTMPVSLDALKYAGQYNQIVLLEKNRIITHSLFNKSTKLKYLGDLIPISKPYVFPKIISIGDLIIALGVFILIQSYIKINRQEVKIKNYKKSE